MHCAICDREDESVTHINKDCPQCQSVISDTIAGYGLADEEFERYEDEMLVP